jgi:hypothetical protein
MFISFFGCVIMEGVVPQWRIKPPWASLDLLNVLNLSNTCFLARLDTFSLALILPTFLCFPKISTHVSPRFKGFTYFKVLLRLLALNFHCQTEDFCGD